MAIAHVREKSQEGKKKKSFGNFLKYIYILIIHILLYFFFFSPFSNKKGVKYNIDIYNLDNRAKGS